MGSRHVIAVDQSTSATKAILFDDRAAPVHRVTIEHRQFYPRPGWVEHDAEEILGNTVAAIKRVLEETSVERSSLEALAITNQRETVVVWDEKSGKPLSHALVWQDERGIPYCRAATERMGAQTIREKTGLIVDSYFSASKLQWLMENDDAVRSSARQGRALCGTIDSWLIWNLTGGRVFATDYSNASRTLLFDIARLEWDDGLLDTFGVSGLRYPEPRPADASFGDAHIDGIPGSIPIIGVMGDSHAALFGQGAFERGGAKATYGTGSSIMMNIGTSPQSPPEGVVSSVGWGIDDSVSYVFEANVHSTGDTLRWVRDNLGLFRDFKEAEELAASIPDNRGVYLVPAFAGLGAPHWAHGVRALIGGISRGTGRREIVRAALESIAYQVADVVRAMSTDAAGLTALRVDGAPTANRLLMQFQANILGAPIDVAPIEEVSARGVVFAAGLRQGIWSGIDVLHTLAQSTERYRPAIEDSRRQELITGWKRAVKQTLAGQID